MAVQRGHLLERDSRAVSSIEVAVGQRHDFAIEAAFGDGLRGAVDGSPGRTLRGPRG
jgi:hypothetical protein